MKNKITVKQKLIALAFVVLGPLSTSHLSAAVVAYNVSWSGAALGNAATATAVISLDTAAAPVSTSVHQAIAMPSWLVDLQLTVVGATSGNGTFQKSDFSRLVWFTNGGTLNLNQELIGQATTGSPWGTANLNTSAGDFNLIKASGSPSAPNGTNIFVLTPSGSGDSMRLVSFAPVPEPSGAALLLTGLAVAAGRRRRLS
jgi:hypothetical protein